MKKALWANKHEIGKKPYLLTFNIFSYNDTIPYVTPSIGKNQNFRSLLCLCIQYSMYKNSMKLLSQKPKTRAHI